MPGNAGAPRVIRFGVFEVDLRAGELRKSGLKIRLQEQPFQVLAMLLEHPGEVVPREELQKKLWSTDTFVDFEHGVNTAVSKIREALGDSAESPHFVETLPRRGYRFTAPVDAVAPVYDRRGLSALIERRYRVFAAALVIAVALGVAGWFWLGRSRSAPETPLIAVPLTSYPGSEDSPSFSPDGSQVAFMWNGEREDNWDIYVKVIGSESPLRLTTNPAREFSPAWSPDGRWIAFCRALPGDKHAVVLTSPIAGPERILTELYSPPMDLEPPYLAWNPDSTWLAMVGAESLRKLPTSLFLYSLANGERRRLTSPPANILGDSSPAFSPDGHTLAFSRRTNYGSSDVYAVALSPELKPLAEPRRLTFGNWDSLSLAWVSDGAALVLSAFSGSDTSLWKVDISRTGSPQRLASLGRNVSSPAVSRRGNHLAYAQKALDMNIWRMELPSPGRKAGPPRKLISSTRTDWCPLISPDGKRIAFVSDRSGSWEIWICDSDGSNLRQLTSYGKDVSVPQWSPDSSRVTFAANPEGRYEIFTVGANGGSPKRLNASPVGSNNPSWSRDGRWIFYDDLAASGRICKVPVEGGSPVCVTTKYWGAVEAPQGDSIYAMETTPTGQDLWRVPAKGGAAQKVLESLPDHLGYALVEGGIYFIGRAGPNFHYSLHHLNTVTGRVERVAWFEKPVREVSVSPDRRWVVYAQQDEVGSDLMLVEDFR